jgi:alcohol dehydrogenase
MSNTFSIARLPRIEFGAGTISKLPTLVRNYGTHALLIIGARSLKDAGVWPDIESSLASAGIGWQSEAISGEPSPQRVDEIARRYR